MDLEIIPYGITYMQNTIQKMVQRFPGQSTVKTLIPVQETSVRFLVRELRSHLLHSLHSLGKKGKKEDTKEEKTIQINLFMKQTHRYRKQIYDYLRGRGRRDTLGNQD